MKKQRSFCQSIVLRNDSVLVMNMLSGRHIKLLFRFALSFSSNILRRYNVSSCVVFTPVMVHTQTWYTDDLRVEKRTKRQRERSWRKSRLEVNRQLYADQCKRVNALLTKTKCAYYSSKIHDTGKNQQRLYRIVNCLLHRKVGTMFPTYTSET